MVRGPELLPLQIRHKNGQRTLDDLGGIAVRDSVPEKVLRPSQLVAKTSARREADLVAVGRQRGHHRTSRFG